MYVYVLEQCSVSQLRINLLWPSSPVVKNVYVPAIHERTIYYPRLENYSIFWLVKTTVIKNPYSRVLLGVTNHLTNQTLL